eukprot:955586-Rhodomonas_salina.2
MQRRSKGQRKRRGGQYVVEDEGRVLPAPLAASGVTCRGTFDAITPQRHEKSKLERISVSPCEK